jgi:hypothetical protein
MHKNSYSGLIVHDKCHLPAGSKSFLLSLLSAALLFGCQLPVDGCWFFVIRRLKSGLYCPSSSKQSAIPGADLLPCFPPCTTGYAGGKESSAIKFKEVQSYPISRHGSKTAPGGGQPLMHQSAIAHKSLLPVDCRTDTILFH